MSEWIKCNDQLPENDNLVLGWWPNQIKFMRYLDDDGLWTDEEYIEWEVTHWMPLPEPPK